MKNLIILNPASFHGKTVEKKEQLEEFLKKLGMDYKIHISKSTDDITETVRSNINNFTNFISFGGDGTLHYIANVLAKTDKNVGCIPMGSGNDIARNMQIPMNIEKCCLILKNPKIKKIDLGLINRKYYYLAISGTGFDSVVNDLANNTKFPLKGPAKYKYAVYKTLITFRSKTFFFKYDGIERNLNAMMLAVGNMTTYGGGMRITPDADPTDGILDLCIIKRMSKIHFIKTFPSVYEGTHINDSFVEYLKVKNVEIDSEYNFSIFADGEFICKLPAKFEVLPKTLNFISINT